MKIFVGGLSDLITDAEIKQKFKSFGANTCRVDMLPHKQMAYVHTELDTASWIKCMKALNGAQWKGSTLRIALARPDYKERLWAESDDHEKKRLLKKRKERYFKPVVVDKQINVLVTGEI